jgi:hypothetical protein
MRMRFAREMMMRRTIAVGLMAFLLGVGAARTTLADPGVTVALTPDAQLVDPGSIFDIFLEVTQAGDAFNAFQAVISYDPAALTLVPASPTDLQQGSYMTNACGNTFHVFKAHAGVDTITDVLLCSGVSLTGPGQIYHLQFQASSTEQLTHLQLGPGVQFYNAGLAVLPVTTSDAVVTIGSPVGVGEPAAPSLELAVAPNPSRGRLVFAIGSEGAGPQSLSIFDLQGRLVRRMETRSAAAETRRVAWDGRNDNGTLVAPGVYLVRLAAGADERWCRITILQ